MGAVATARSVVDRAREEQLGLLAASIAYHAFFSIVPLLLLVLAIGSPVGGQAFADRLVDLVGDQLSAQGRTVTERALTSPSGRGGASVVGVVGLLWGGLKVFRAVDVAFDRVYRVGEDSSLVRQLVDGVLLLVLVGLAAVVTIGLGAVIRRAELIGVPGVSVLGWIGLVVGLLVVFLPVFYVMAPVDVHLREVVPGAVFAVAGWLVLQAGFQVYAATAGDYQAYGLLGAVMLFLAWLYFAGVLVLLGATINAVLSDR
ncbi:YihY/virulence factor BrkB family protein [Natronococcus wangiae]|uniref:YihY/virulence factor BrkB family protein n=1 Tax=Natronococcus wangiae TaxID=3068275 RepID=UPI00273DD6E6|nr:YihY/virulence factor BrkB family protein [Natronococcus sp. AD5]